MSAAYIADFTRQHCRCYDIIAARYAMMLPPPPRLMPLSPPRFRAAYRDAGRRHAIRRRFVDYYASTHAHDATSLFC